MNEHDTTFMQTLALADLTLLTSKLFASPMALSPETFHIDEQVRRRLEELTKPLGDGLLLESLIETIELVHETPKEAWRYEWNRLFEGTVLCPINETAYVRRDKGMIISDICGFYNAFGFEPDQHSAEKADHLSCELEYVALLLVMIANACRDGDETDREVTTKALQVFLNEHLGEWIPYFANRLNECSALAMYGQVVKVLRQLWNVLAERFDLTMFDELDDSETNIDFDIEDTPYECDLAAEPSEFVPITGPSGSGLPQHDEPITPTRHPNP